MKSLGFDNVWTTESKQLALSIFDATVSAFTSTGVTPLLAYGSLLGAMRDGRIIPWDGDIDLCLPESENWDAALEKLAAEGFLPYKEHSTRCDRISHRNGKPIKEGWTWPWVDLYPYVTRGNDVVWQHASGKTFTKHPKRFVETLSTVVFEGRTCYTVSEPEKYLDLVYPKWRTKHVSSKVDHLNPYNPIHGTVERLACR